jgi:hypothetical protein
LFGITPLQPTTLVNLNWIYIRFPNSTSALEGTAVPGLLVKYKEGGEGAIFYEAKGGIFFRLFFLTNPALSMGTTTLCGNSRESSLCRKWMVFFNKETNRTSKFP